MTDGFPEISVIVATRDRPVLAERALASIASQTFQNFEVVIVDDGSEPKSLDGYRGLCERYGHRFVLHNSAPPGSLGSGPAAVRNRGIFAARGRYVAFLDDDDEWTKEDHLEVALRSLTQTGADFYFADIQGVRAENVVLETWYEHPPQSGATPAGPDLSKVFLLERAALVRVFRHHMIHPDCWVVERRLLTELHGFNERLRFVEDLELGFRIVDRFRGVAYRAEPVVRYRLPEGDAESLKYDRLTILHQYALAAQTLRATCGRPEVRRCARAREGWALRQIAAELTSRGHRSAARSFSWQSLATFPTPSALYAFVVSLIRS